MKVKKLTKAQATYVDDLYTSVSKPGALSSIKNLYKLIKSENKYKNITLAMLAQYMKKSDVYTMYKAPSKRAPAQSRLFSLSINHTHQSDLIHLDRYADENDGYVAILLCIDFTSVMFETILF